VKFRPASILTVIVVGVILAAWITAMQWPLRASILVLVLGAIGLIVGAILLYTETRPGASDKKAKSGMDIESDESMSAAEVKRRTIDIWAWLAGLILGIWLIGFQAAVVVFSFAYAKVHGSRWLTALVLAAVAYVLCWGLFDMIIHIVWPEPFLLQFFRG